MTHNTEKGAGIASLAQRRARRDESHPAPGEPAITFGMDDDRITFRDQAALDDYVHGALAGVAALIPVFEAKYGIQSSPVALLRGALSRPTSPAEGQS